LRGTGETGDREVVRGWDGVADLVLGGRCAGCERPGVTLCGGCRRLL